MPYFFGLPEEESKKVSFYTSFDECFQKINQKRQMDLNVSCWSDIFNFVVTSYSSIVLEHFHLSRSKIEGHKVMQVSTVGPNLNLKFLQLINKGRSAYGNSDLILIVPCDLHKIHRAFQHDAKDSSWSFGKVLQAMWKILDQSPSRRADYDRITSPTENVFERTESVLDNFVSLINYWKTWLISKQPDKNNKSYLTVQEAVTDPSIKTKFIFF